MEVVDLRLIEIVGIALRRPLTAKEAREMKESYQYIINREWKHARIINLMKLARETRDWVWGSKLAAEYDELKGGESSC